MDAAELTGSPPAPTRFTFTQGFLVGQASIVLLAVLFVKYVIFEDATTALEKEHKRRKTKARRGSTRGRSASNALNPKKAFVPDILGKLGFDVDHPAESVDWLNVVVAQAFVAYRALMHGEGLEGAEEETAKLRSERARKTVEEAVNYRRSETPQGFIGTDYITVTEVDFGDAYPICSNAVVRPADETGRMRVEVDVDYSDHVTLAIDTKVVVNFPRPRFAVLPVSLGLTLNTFHATVMSEIPPTVIPFSAGAKGSPSPAILISLDPDFTLTMSTTSLLGSRAKLQDIPKLEQLILGRLRSWIVDNLVWPKVRILRLPGIGRKGNVEEGEGGEGEFVWIEGVPERRHPRRKFASELSPSETADETSSTSAGRPPTLSQAPTSTTSEDLDSSLPDLLGVPAFESTPVGGGRSRPPDPSPATEGRSTRSKRPSFGAHLGQGAGAPAATGAAGAPNASDPRSAILSALRDGSFDGPGGRAWRASVDGSAIGAEKTAQWARSGGMASVGLGRSNSGSSTPFDLRERMKGARGHGGRRDDDMYGPVL